MVGQQRNKDTVEKTTLISVKEARKLLGKDAANLDDNQVGEIISTLTLMARHYLRKSSSKKYLGVY